MILADVLPLDMELGEMPDERLAILAARMAAAKDSGSAVILIMGAHVIKVGMSRFVIDLMERGYLTHVALNGAGVIHDYELALIGASTESVARYIRNGEFGLWRETGEINDIIREGAVRGEGVGEAMGRYLSETRPPHVDISILAAGWRLGIPVTCHIAIGQDITHEHPNFDGAAVGKATYEDFLIFTESVSRLEGGVMLNVGTSVMGPEVYLKALAMARNVAQRKGETIAHFTTVVFDLIELGEDLHSEAPKSDPRYYYRPFKTILVRTVSDGGESFYIRADHRESIPHLRRLLLERENITAESPSATR